MTASESKRYLPAAGKDIFLPLYDPLTRLMGFKHVHGRLIAQARLESANRVLDVGCGTGTLAVLIKSAYPKVELTALDPDPKALVRADRKAARANASVHFQQGFADRLPFPDASFDRVFSSMMFHHLPPEDRLGMLREVARVLRPAGEFHMVDFSGEDHGFLAHVLHSHKLLRNNESDKVLSLMTQGGLSNPVRTATQRTLFGGIAYYSAGR